MIDISIIVPVYNGEKYIEKCIESVLKTTKKNFEIIVINDGSNDNTQSIVENIISKSPDKVVLHNLINNGVGKTRNFGLKEAKGKYVAFLDSDDYILDGMYDLLYEKAELENLDLVVCGYYRVDEQDNILFSEMKMNNFELSKINTSPWNKIFRKDFLTKYNIKFGEDVWYEDVQFILSCIAITQNIGYIKEELYCYVQRESSSINQFSGRVKDIFKVANNVLDFCENVNMKYDKELIEYHIIMHLVFGHLSRCINERNLFKRHAHIKKTRIFLERYIPNYYKNKYLKLTNFKNQFSFFSIVRYLGLFLFRFNIYDIFLLVYQWKTIFDKNNLKRW